jgi:hypothetical protein
MNLATSGICRHCATAFTPLLSCTCGRRESSAQPLPMKPATTVEQNGEEQAKGGETLEFDCMVQHSVSSGKPPTIIPGKVSLSIVATPEGAVVVLGVQHSDGTVLGALVPADGGPQVVEAFERVFSEAAKLDEGMKGKKS